MAANQTQGWQFIDTTQILECGRHKIQIVEDLTLPHKDIDGDNHFFISPNPLTALWHGFGNIAIRDGMWKMKRGEQERIKCPV